MTKGLFPALAALFLLGWFAGRHAGAAASGRRVLSGWLLTVLLAILVMAGCAQLFLTSPEWQSAIALVHQILGAALVLPVLAHSWRFSAASRASAPAQRHGRGHGHGQGHAPAHDPARSPRSAHN